MPITPTASPSPSVSPGLTVDLPTDSTEQWELASCSTYLSETEYSFADGRTRAQLLTDCADHSDDESWQTMQSLDLTMMSRSSSSPVSQQSYRPKATTTVSVDDSATYPSDPVSSSEASIFEDSDGRFSVSSSPVETLSRTSRHSLFARLHEREDYKLEQSEPDSSVALTYDPDAASLGALSNAEAESWYLMSGWSSEGSDYDQAAADVVRIAPALAACVPGVLADRAELASIARQQVESFYDVYIACGKLALEADLTAREAYECLLEPSALSAAASQPDRLKSAHLAAKLGASMHLEAAAAARAFRGGCAVYATYAFGAADKATATRVPLLVRGRDALQVAGLALSAELQHSMLASMFIGVTRTNDPCQPLAIGHAFRFASPEVLESMVRRSLRPVPHLDEQGRPDQTTPESATSYQEVLNASESSAQSWQAHLDNVRIVEILFGDFTEAHDKHVEWMRIVSRHFDSALVTEHESQAALQAKIVNALQQSLLADVPPELPDAQAHLLAAASSAVTAAASTYALHLEHLILIAFATPQGNLPQMPQNIEMPAVLRYFTSSADSVSNARNVHTNVLAARDKIAYLVGKLVSAFQEFQRIPAFRFKDLSEL